MSDQISGSALSRPRKHDAVRHRRPDGAYHYPPPDDGQPVVIDGGRWDGVGFRSTGLVGSFPPVVVTVRQTFTKAGAYPYRCLSLPVPPSPCRRRPGGRVRVSVAQAELLHLA